MECISSQLIEKKGTIVLLISFVRFKEGNDFVKLAVLIQKSRFCGQFVEAGRPFPLGSLSYQSTLYLLIGSGQSSTAENLALEIALATGRATLTPKPGAIP